MVSDKIKSILKQENVKISELATYMNMKPQSLANKFSRDSWSVQDLISVLDFLGYQLIMQSKPDNQIILTMDDAKK